MGKILIVEDSRVFRNLIKNKIANNFDYECVTADCYKDAREILEKPAHNFVMAILDLNLPDAPNGEIVEYVVSKNIATIVITALINNDIRDQILAHGVLDYILKEGVQSLDQLEGALHRYLRNQRIHILVVDDSRASRSLTRRMLEKHNYQVLEAEGGDGALRLLEKNPQVRLVICDYEMPNMNGAEFTARIREKTPMDETAVIGMSALGNPILSAQFLKTGANDFVNKPYYEEEFLWRINQNVEMLENIRTLKDAAIWDHLTGLDNRRYFFSLAGNLYENAKRKNIHITIGMIDIDNFKIINDTYGHAVGDEVLQHLSKVLSSILRASDVVARYGGEEFIVLATGKSEERNLVVFERIRREVEKTPVETRAGVIHVTVSIGLASRLQASLDEMIKEADDFLYRAKASGRNCIVAQ
jgi:diguanylate cyclase (GGDEF)-like protein